MTSSKCWQGAVWDKTDICGWQVLEQKCQSYSGVALFWTACARREKSLLITPKLKKERYLLVNTCQQTWAQIQVSARLLLGLGDWKGALGAVSPRYFKRVRRMQKRFPLLKLWSFAASLNQNFPVTALCMDTVQTWTAVPDLRQQESRSMADIWRTTLSVHVCCRFGLASLILSSSELKAWIMETADWQMWFPSLGRWQCL